MLTEIESFVNWVRRRNPQARTWRDYGYDLKAFVAVVGDKSPSAVTFQDVDAFVTAQAGQGYQASTMNRRLAAVVSLYNFLADEWPNLVCPVLPHRHLLRQRQRLPRPVGSQEVERFFAVIGDERDKVMFLLMLRGGLRIGEVAGLKMQDVYLDETPPRLLVAGKNSRERSVYLSEQAEAALRLYLSQRPFSLSDFVFLSYQGEGMSTTAIHKRLMHYRVQAGVSLTGPPATPHLCE